MPGEHSLHIPREDAAGSQLVPIARFGEEGFATQSRRRVFDRLLEWQMLECVQRVVVDEDADRTLCRQQVGQPIDHRSQRV